MAFKFEISRVSSRNSFVKTWDASLRHTALRISWRTDGRTDGRTDRIAPIIIWMCVGMCGDNWVKKIQKKNVNFPGGDFRHFFEKGDPETCLQKMEFFYLENKKSAKNTLTIRWWPICEKFLKNKKIKNRGEKKFFLLWGWFFKVDGPHVRS